jgi:hypothetical protein
MSSVVLVDPLRGIGDRFPPRHSREPLVPVLVTLGDVVQHDADRPLLPRHHELPLGVGARPGERDDLVVRRREIFGECRRALRRLGHEASPPTR